MCYFKKLKKGDDVLNTFKERSNYLKAISLMSIFTFIFLGIEYLFVDMISLLVSENRVVLSQNYVLGMSCLGFILYPLYNRYFKGLPRKICIVISAIVIIGLITIIYLHPTYPLTLITGLILFLFLGGLGGVTSYKALCILPDQKYLARCVGLSYMIGILLQFINNNFISVSFIESIVLDIFMCLLMFILTTVPNTLNHHLDVSMVKKERQICGGLLILLVFMMSCVFSTLDNAVTLLHATGEVNVEELPRILLALSGFIGGIIFDLKERRFMSMTMYCVMVLSTICIVIIKYSELYLIGLIVFYMTSGFFVVFFTTSFMEIAMYMKFPDLWAGLGRGVNNLAAMLLTKGSLFFINSQEDLTAVILAICLFFFVSIIAFTYVIQRKKLIEKLSESRKALLTKEEKLLKIKEHYAFTPRESEVFEYLISTEDSVQDIANNMYVSKRTLERYISAIYKKTGVKSRVSLLNIYNNYENTLS